MKIKETNSERVIKDGILEEYFSDRKLSNTGQFQGDKKSGEWKYYLRNGKLKTKGKFLNGQMTGAWK